MVKRTTPQQRADRKAAEQLIAACEHFGIDPKKVARIIAILKEPDDSKEESDGES